jgi:hypothetical protein
MKNVYDGVVVLDNKGKAEIELPEWFGALNKDFRYQLTAIGSPGPNLYIAEEISETQEMLDFCGKHNITADVEVIPIQKVNEAYDRMLKSDVKYRFSIDMASLKSK